MRSVISLCAIVLIIVTCCSLVDAKPFINLFNVAVKTDFGEDGNVVSFVYPKNKYQLELKFNTETLHENSFNIGGLFQSIARNFRKRISNFNPFKFLTTTTTTEAPLDFADEDKEGDSVSDGGVDSSDHSLADNESESDKDTSDDSSSSSGGEESDDEVKGDSAGGVLSSGYNYPSRGSGVSIESAAITYLPPSTPRSSYLPSN